MTVDRLWRVTATGLAFATLFLGGGVLATAVFPSLQLIPGRRQERAQWVIHWAFRFYVQMLQVFGLIRLEVTDAEKLSACRGHLIIANHPTLLDVVLLMALAPKVRCVIKHQLWSHRFLGGAVRAAGYIRNDLETEQLVNACRQTLETGSNLIIFPEGTRSIPGAPIRFHRGFANIATLTGASVQLVVITCEPPTLMKGESWYRVPERRPLFRVAVAQCVHSEAYMGYRYRGLGARRLIQVIEEYYRGKLANLGT